MWREHLHSGAFADDLKLVDRSGPLKVTRDEKWRMPLAPKPFRELAGQRRLA
jgi:hypothetical protein